MSRMSLGIESEKLNIILADDHTLFRKTIKCYISNFRFFANIYEANNGCEVLDILGKYHVDVILLDMNMPVMNGYKTVIQIRKRCKVVKVLMLSMYQEESLIMNLIKIGINGYMSKADEHLEAALAIAVKGYFYYSREFEPIIKKAQQGMENLRPVSVSEREASIIHFISEGKSSEEIAILLGLSRQTIESYRKNLLSKFKVRNTGELISYIYSIGLM